MKTLLGLVLASLSLTASASAADPKSVLVDRVADTGFIQLHAESFRALSPKQQETAYWLTQAAIAIDPIIYDQLSAFGLREKRLLEEILARPGGIDPALRPQIESYAKLFWANRGNHNLSTSQKFVPSFSAADLRKAAASALKQGAFKTSYADLRPLASMAELKAELDALEPAIFSPDFEPMITAKSPQGGKDIIQASSTTFYSGLTLADLKDFHGTHPLNSRLVKGADGTLTEEVYRAGTPDGQVPAGLYAVFLRKAITCLEHAAAAAEPAQATVIRDLIRFYQTGEYSDLLTADSAWVQNDAVVDFLNGFVEIYRDANGMKASSQAFVTITDVPMSTAMSKLAKNAAYFESHAPWLDAYKKKDFVPPVIKAVEVLIETGDFEVNTIGDNLPNENEVHEKYGSKNFLFTGSSRAIRDATGLKSIQEFFADPETIARQENYGEAADSMLTALHEVIGHGSGKLSPRLKSGSESYLKEYFSSLEEGRADLMALWNIWDPKLVELGLVKDQEQVAKAMYDRAAVNVIAGLRNIPTGDTIEEDHLRDRALITNYIMDRTGAIEQFKRDGKTYVRVTDYQKMRAGVGQLLAELMRIKAEGDYAAIQTLIEKYGVHFDPAVRDEVIARYQKLELPTYWAGVNPVLTARVGANGKTGTVHLAYIADPIRQYLSYGAMYDRGLLVRP